MGLSSTALLQQILPDATDTRQVVIGSVVLVSVAHLNPIEPFVFPGQPRLHAGYERVPELEFVLRQHGAICCAATNSAFIGTTLEVDLRVAAIATLIITGVITNNSVEATATFARPDFNGVLRSAEEVHAMSLANLQDEYATILTTQGILTALI